MKENLIEEIKNLNYENDLFGTYNKAQAICEFLELEDNKSLLEKNNLIAIYGPWGIGKSSVMKTIQNNLNRKDFDTLWFNTWKYEKDVNFPYSLFKYIIKRNCVNKSIRDQKCILEKGYEIFKTMGKNIEFNMGMVNFKTREAINDIEKRKCLWEIIEEFEQQYKKINCNNKRLVVFLDDLDRCESENIINLISSVKLLLATNPNIIFIIGVDREAVTLALQNKYNNDFNKADEYLEKIFPINFSIDNNIYTKTFKDFIEEIMELSSQDADTILRFFNEINFNNSRHIKKVLRKYVSIRTYLIRHDIDLKNKYNIILVLYFIIINMFYCDEYKYLLMKDKEKIYREILIVYQDNRTGIKMTKSFESCYSKSCKFDFSLLEIYNIYDFLVRFSSYKLKKNELDSIINIDNTVEIIYNNWIELFGYNICSAFIEFVIYDDNFRKMFFTNKKYDEEKVFKILKTVNDII